LNDNGVNVFAAFVSPVEFVRQTVREIIGCENFRLVYVSTCIDVCIERDYNSDRPTKGLWHSALAGEILNFTGLDSPYEVPVSPDVSVPSVGDIDSIVGTMVHEFFPEMFTPAALFIGRWQPFHNGHYHCIMSAISQGKNVVVAIRDTPLSESDPYTATERKEMIEATFKGLPVRTILIPDIESVNIGRKVGYTVNRIDVPENIEGISATDIRELIANSDDSWKTFVPSECAKYLEELSVSKNKETSDGQDLSTDSVLQRRKIYPRCSCKRGRSDRG